MPTDEETLKSWSFLKDYHQKRGQLIDLATAVYLVACAMLHTRPTQGDCYAMYWPTLLQTSLYHQIAMKKQHLNPIFYEAFAQVMARHVLNENWSLIEQSKNTQWP